MAAIPTIFSNFMPPHSSFQPVSYEEEQPEEKSNTTSASFNQKPPASDLLSALTGGIFDTLGNIFKDFSLKNLDSGDLLLLLIILFLFLEGDNVDLVIALGLMFLLGFGSEPHSSN